MLALTLPDRATARNFALFCKFSIHRIDVKSIIREDNIVYLQLCTDKARFFAVQNAINRYEVKGMRLT